MARFAKFEQSACLYHNFIFSACDPKKFGSLFLCSINNCGNHQLTEYNCELGQYCTDCIEMTKAPSYHDWAHATCAAPSTCKKCGATEGDPIGHGYDGNVTHPDCVNGGYTTYTCCNCGDSFVADEVDALGHTYDAIVTDPDCENGGYTTYICCECGNTYTGDEVDALGHEWVDATYTAPKTCSVCGETDGEPLESEESSEENSEENAASGSDSETVGAIESAGVSESETGVDNSLSLGCGASIGTGALAIVAIAGIFGAVIMRKKEDEA